MSVLFEKCVEYIIHKIILQRHVEILEGVITNAQYE